MPTPGSNTATAFKHGIANIENIDDEIAELKEQIKGLKGDRKAKLMQIQAETGFVPKVTDQILRERKMDPVARQDFTIQLQIARATMGLLDGTPLGDAARKAYDKPQAPSESRTEDESQEPLPGVEDLPKPPSGPTQEDLARAREEGAAGARAGQKVTDNPYPADQAAMRAAYDEGWCTEAGSDGMDIPESLRPKKKKGDGPDDQRKAA